MVHRCGTFVYFISAPSEHLIKIGYSFDGPDRRFAAIQAASPVPVERMALVAGSRFFEQLLHIRFSGCRAHLEWFHAEDDLVSYVGKHAWPWTGPVGSFVKAAGIPKRCHEHAIAKADPWFGDMVRSCPEASFYTGDDAVMKRATRCLELLKNFAPTAKAAERSHSEAIELRRMMYADLVDIVFVGGPNDGWSYQVPRFRLGPLLKDGHNQFCRYYYETYTLGREPTEDDLQAKSVRLRYSGRAYG